MPCELDWTRVPPTILQKTTLFFVKRRTLKCPASLTGDRRPPVLHFFGPYFFAKPVALAKSQKKKRRRRIIMLRRGETA